MIRAKWLAKNTKANRNRNIARLYFNEDKTLKEIQLDYPDLSLPRIFRIAYENKDKYDK